MRMPYGVRFEELFTREKGVYVVMDSVFMLMEGKIINE